MSDYVGSAHNANVSPNVAKLLLLKTLMNSVTPEDRLLAEYIPKTENLKLFKKLYEDGFLARVIDVKPGSTPAEKNTCALTKNTYALTDYAISLFPEKLDELIAAEEFASHASRYQ